MGIMTAEVAAAEVINMLIFWTLTRVVVVVERWWPVENTFQQ